MKVLILFIASIFIVGASVGPGNSQYASHDRRLSDPYGLYINRTPNYSKTLHNSPGPFSNGFRGRRFPRSKTLKPAANDGKLLDIKNQFSREGFFGDYFYSGTVQAGELEK
ncbi:uncharacterized protein LOC124460417 [Drosophila willistoni]|uniref:uncharacterized protein LOC124460417 n=1 Tax=Drosophila willistoni TaxID=7260 RepID=UPI001F0853C8|nr:uncharacterized protein LOC124460417 [Drosophila willistoni]